MTLLLRCSLRYWQQHYWQAVLMLIGIALGVAIVFSVDIANQSAKRAFALSLDAITGRTTHQIVSGESGIDERIYTQLRRELKFRNSAPVVEGALTLTGKHGRESLQLIGIDLFSEPMFRDQLHYVSDSNSDADASVREGLALLQFGAIVTGDSVAARLGVEVGDKLTVADESRPRQLQLVNRVDTSLHPAFDAIVMTDISTAQWLLNLSGKLSRIDLIVGDSEQLKIIEETFDGISLVDAASRNTTLQQMTQAFHTNLVAMSLLALLVGAFLIYNTVTLSVLQRRVVFGQLRGLGVDRQGIFGAVIVEVIVFVVIGIATGLIVGTALGSVLLNLVTRTINDLYFTLEVRRLDIPIVAIVKVVTLALFTAMVAVLVPAYEAANSPPVTLTQRSSLELKTKKALPWLSASGCGVALLGALIIWCSHTLLMAFVALFFIVIGYSLLIPQCLSLLVKLSENLLADHKGATGSYPLRSLAASLSRTSVAVTALAIAVSATAGVGIMIDSFRGSVAHWLDQTLQADVYIRDSESLSTALPDRFVESLQEINSVVGLRLVRMLDIEAASEPVRLMALGFEGEINRGLSLLPDAVSERNQWQTWSGPDAVFVSEPMAYRHSLESGSELPVVTEHGLQNFLVAGVFTDYGAGRGVVVIPMATMHRYWSDRDLSSVGMVLSPGSGDEPEKIRELVNQWPGLLMRSDREIRELSMQVFDRTFAITHILRLLTAGVAFVGILSALLALILERQREFAILRTLGVLPSELRRLLVAQTAWMGLVAGLVALPLGIAMSAILVAVINRRSFGWSMQFEVSSTVLLECLVLAVIAAMLASVYPAWRLGKLLPTSALRQ